MKTLYLMRHAHTVSAAPPLMGDHERILSPQGTADAIMVGRYMESHEMYPDFVLSSSSVRTIQTARLIFGVLFRTTGVKVASHFDRKFYQAPAARIFSEICGMDDSIGQLLMVGHNPGIAELAIFLSNKHQFQNYAPATLCVFRAECKSWADFSPDTATLTDVFVPDNRPV